LRAFFLKEIAPFSAAPAQVAKSNGSARHNGGTGRSGVGVPASEHPVSLSLRNS